MKKRGLVFLLLTVSLLLTLPFAARADLIIAPYNNVFFTRHRDECTYLWQRRYANGENGFVSAKEEPGSEKETIAVENGERLNIMFTYNYEGEEWGVATIHTSEQSAVPISGWIPMEQLLLLYDELSFAEEYGHEFYRYIGSYDSLKTAEELVFWSWPGSGIMQNPESIPGSIISAKNEEYSFFSAYKDEEGREWIHASYVQGRESSGVWVCISDPENREIPAFNPPPELAPWLSATPSKSALSTPWLITILVAVLVAGTVVLVRIFWKPKKTSE